MAGFKPIVENLILSRDADYLHIFRRHSSDPEFPVGTTAEIVFTEDSETDSEVLASWPAEDVSSDDVSFWVQSEDANLIPARVRWRLLIHYPPVVDGAQEQDFVWFRGSVKREQ